MLIASGTITAQNQNPTAGVATPGSFVPLANPSPSTAGLNPFQSPGETQTYADASNFKTLVVQVTGTYTGALSIQESLDGVNWVANGVITPITSTTAAATIPTATPGIYVCSISGARQVRVSALAAFSGSAVITMTATTSPVTP